MIGAAGAASIALSLHADERHRACDFACKACRIRRIDDLGNIP